MIVGAGFAGLIAAHVFPQHNVYEAAAYGVAGNHHALMRFRSTAVSELTGVPFRPVTVHKGIWEEGEFHVPNIRLANAYARKVLGHILDRSIWHLTPVTRYVAPEDFYERLLDNVGHRIFWQTPVNFHERRDEPLINTAPLPVVLGHLEKNTDLPFHRTPIHVRKYRVPGADVFQTIYFPGFLHNMYRASITEDLLICEFAGPPTGPWEMELSAAFALPGNILPVGEARQHYGKIEPIDEGARKALIAQLTREHGIFSIGRFATWRNILLDDVVHDAAVVKRLIGANEYERHLAAL